MYMNCYVQKYMSRENGKTYEVLCSSCCKLYLERSIKVQGNKWSEVNSDYPKKPIFIISETEACQNKWNEREKDQGG
jgi:hypothetical protein